MSVRKQLTWSISFMAIVTGAALIYAALGIGTVKASTGSIFVANEYTKLTTESTAPSGYIASSTVEATYFDGANPIPVGSDLIKVIVTDADRDTLTNVTVSGGTQIQVDDNSNGPGDDDNILTGGPGSQTTLFISSTPVSPISGDNSSISIISGGVDIVATGVLSIVARFDGVVSPAQDPLIRVQRNTGSGPITISDISYDTSTLDTAWIFVSSEIDPTPVTVTALETGLSSGRFEGYVRLVSNAGASSSSIVPGDQNAAVRTVVGPVNLFYKDSDGVNRQTQVQVNTDPELPPVPPGPTPPPVGSVFVANEASEKTDESPAPAGYQTEAPVKAAYSDSGSVIPPDADLIKVIIDDPGRDILTGVSVSSPVIKVDNNANGSSDDDNVLTIVASQQVTIHLEGQSSIPMTGNIGAIQVISGGQDIVGAGVLTIVGRFEGVVSPPADPWIKVQRNAGVGPITIDEIVYGISEPDSVGVSVFSDIEAIGVSVLALETGPSTGRFEGFVRLVEPTGPASVDSTIPGDKDARIRVDAGPVEFEYVDSISANLDTQVVINQSLEFIAEGSLFVTNEWSFQTSESPAPIGYTEASTIYGTTADPTVRLIQTNSDLIRVVVSDSGRDLLTPVTVTGSTKIQVDENFNGPGDDDNVLSIAAGQPVVIFIDQSPVLPIAGLSSDIKIISGGVDIVESGILEILQRIDGSVSPANDPWIQVQRNSGTGPITISEIEYPTSVPDAVEIAVTSELEAGSITVSALETGISTGRFEGFVRLSRPAVHASTSSVTPGDLLAQIRTSAGPIDLSYVDSATVMHVAQVQVDTTAPVTAVTAPVNGTSTQNRTPVFSGSIADGESGLKINKIEVLVDTSNDQVNLSPIITDSGVTIGTPGSLFPSTTGFADGDTAFSFSKAWSGGDLPSPFITNPDHIVDWVVKSSDVAGNIGFSDADPANQQAVGAGNIIGGYQIHTVKIDRISPFLPASIGEHKTGLWFDGVSEVVTRNALRLVFTEPVTGVQASDFVVTLDSGANIVPSSVFVVNNPTAFPNRGVVYLEFATDLLSSETPIVSLQGPIQDLAGNSTAQSSASVEDGIAPQLTVTTSGGTGTGSGNEGPGGVTNDQMTIQVTSDEFLSFVPSLEIFPLGSGSPELTPVMLPSGPNTWSVTFDAGSVEGQKAVVVSAIDTASSVNQTVFGDINTPTYRVDTSIPSPVVTVGPRGVGTPGKVISSQPTIIIDFAAAGEEVSVVLPDVLLDGGAITDPFVPSNGNRTFTVTLSTPLSDENHSLSIPGGMVTDVAGNTLATAVTPDEFEVEAVGLVGFEISPESIPVRFDEPVVVTISVVDLAGLTPDTVQINLAHDDAILQMQNPQCVGIFTGGTTTAIARDTDDQGSAFGCFLVGGAVGTDGPVATFELIRLAPGNPTVNLRLVGDLPTKLIESGVVVGVPDAAVTAEILPGTRITGEVVLQGVTDPVPFASIAPQLTLQNVSGGAPIVVMVESDGTFTIPGVFDGTYDLTLDAEGSLGRKLLDFIISSDDLDLQPIELRSGLSDANDIVEGSDISAVVGNFGSGPADLNGGRTINGLVVDFDGDGFVSAFDISIVVSNFGATKYQAWTDPAAVHPAP